MDPEKPSRHSYANPGPLSLQIAHWANYIVCPTSYDAEHGAMKRLETPTLAPTSAPIPNVGEANRANVSIEPAQKVLLDRW
jgi:hypothetical protein